MYIIIGLHLIFALVAPLAIPVDTKIERHQNLQNYSEVMKYFKVESPRNIAVKKKGSFVCCVKSNKIAC